VSMIIVELASLHQVSKDDGVFKLEKSTFKSPEKPSKNRQDFDDSLAKIATFIEFLILNGSGLDTVREAIRTASSSFGVNADAMDIDSMYTEISANMKKRKT